jgi:hypothetical protein
VKLDAEYPLAFLANMRNYSTVRQIDLTSEAKKKLRRPCREARVPGL